MKKKILIEVCCGSYEDVVNAKAAGADRVELNSALFLGGLTPSLGTLLLCKEKVDIGVIPMVRPRSAGFCYGDFEYRVMKKDAELFLANGADGIVFGFLQKNGKIDKRRTAEFVKLAGDKDTVFHRAFDVVPDPLKALEELIDLGVTRIMTSGQEPTVPEGAELIREMVRQAKGRIQILPGGGITAKNIRSVIKATGVDQVHFAALDLRPEPSVANNRNIYFGGALFPREDVVEVTTRNKVEAVIMNTK